MKIIVVVMLACCGGGCATTGQVNSLTDNTKLFMSKVDEYQAMADKAFALAERDGVISKDVRAYVVNLSNDVNAFKPQLSEIVRAVDEAPDNAVSKAKAAVGAAGNLIPQPYGTLALLGIGIWEAITLKRKRDSDLALTKEEGKRRSEKAGTRKTITALNAMEDEEITAAKVESLLFDNIGVERSRNGLT